jgi:uncharacterized protein YutE (UPF0331/DUF86 family)
LNTFEFISSIIKSLAWPVVVLTIAILLRQPIVKILSNLSKVTYNNLEVNFGEKLDELNSSLESKNIPENNMQNANSNEDEIITLAQISPAASITMAWSMIEQEILRTIKRLRISPDHPLDNSPFKNINLLKTEGLIDLETENTLNELRNLRNKAVHGHPSNENISQIEAIKYYKLSKKVISILKTIRNRNNNARAN